MKLPWLQPPWSPPLLLETSVLRCRPLRLSDVIKDYDAVMFSRKEIHYVFGPDADWPREDLTLEQDMVDLGWHQKEFQLALSFTYTVMSLDESKCLGCLYVMPSQKAGYDAEVIYWVRSHEPAPAGCSSLDEHLGKALREWLASPSWPFKPGKIAFPGREQPWDMWMALPPP